jgi:CRP-like cAMP-binding protein
MTNFSIPGHPKDVIKAPKGTVLMREGEIGKSAFLVLEGRLLVERNIHGENIIIAEVLSRDLVGEMAILDNEPRSATVTAIEDSLLIEFDKHRIKSIIRRSPDIAEVILKLLSHKLRTTHFVIHRASNLELSACWIKICTILKLCAKAETNPEALYTSFVENVLRLAELPMHRMRLVLDRLVEANLIESEGRRITTVKKNRLETFLLHLLEEYANEPFNYTSSAKQYEAVQVFKFFIQPQEPKQEWTEYTKKNLVEMLVNSDLWKELAIQLQMQRAESLLNSLIRMGILSESPLAAGYLRIEFRKLDFIEKPDKSIHTYSTIKHVLMHPMPEKGEVPFTSTENPGSQ